MRAWIPASAPGWWAHWSLTEIGLQICPRAQWSSPTWALLTLHEGELYTQGFWLCLKEFPLALSPYLASHTP